MVNHAQLAQFMKKPFRKILNTTWHRIFRPKFLMIFKPPKNILNLCCREPNGNKGGVMMAVNERVTFSELHTYMKYKRTRCLTR